MNRGLNRFEQASVAAAAILTVVAGGVDLAGAPNTAIFVLSGLALVSLAWIVGVATEQLAESSGPKVGGVLNATFGNAAELIITIFAIRAGQLEVATASITGSILGNTLLVLGASFLVGGLKNGIQTFDQRIAGMNASMLALAVIGLGLPTAFAAARGTGSDTQTISDVTAVILLGLYLLSLVYYFRTGTGATSHPQVPHLTARLAMVLLLASTGAVAVISDIFVGTLEGVISDLGISAAFLGLVIVPIVGNIAENIVGIKIAYQNKMDFSMVVSLGSSLQVALGVAPLLVFISLLTPHHFDLVFPTIQVLALAAAVTITALIAADGESNWLGGRPADGRLRNRGHVLLVPVSHRDRTLFAVVIGLAAAAVGLKAADIRGEFVFGAASVALIGLAWLLGEATDQAGNTAGPRVSALLNATFGNLPEVVIVILAINAGLDDIARASIIGSVIGNILLILGLSLVVGGWKNGVQSFNERVAGTNSSMLILGVAGLGFPTLFAALHSSDSADVLSRWTGAALLVSYGAYLVFSFSMPGQKFEDEAGQARWSVTEAVAALAVTAVATGDRVGGARGLDQADGRAAGCPAGVRGADPHPVRRERGRALLGRPARVPEPRRLLDGDRVRVRHPDRPRGERDRGLRVDPARQRALARLRPVPARGAGRRRPGRHARRPRRRDELARGPSAARDLPDRQRRRLAPVSITGSGTTAR